MCDHLLGFFVQAVECDLDLHFYFIYTPRSEFKRTVNVSALHALVLTVTIVFSTSFYQHNKRSEMAHFLAFAEAPNNTTAKPLLAVCTLKSQALGQRVRISHHSYGTKSRN